MVQSILTPTPDQDRPVIYQLSKVNKSRQAEGARFHLSVPDLHISHGDKIALIGESGCGKSTLLDMLTFISSPTDSDQFRFSPTDQTKPVDIAGLWRNRRANDLAQLRKRYIGYVMQTGGLLPYLTVRDNINLSRHVLELPDDGTVDKLAGDLGISSHLNKLPGSLSIGERQRVAIGRALAHKPAIVIADEPTASLDPFAAKTIMTLFIDLAEEFQVTLIIASHAWRNLRNLGLRRFSYNIRRTEDMTETIVTG